jgi:hypothetical protein
MRPQSAGIFSETATSDISDRLRSMRSWLYDGSHHGTSYIGGLLHVPPQIETHVSLLEDIVVLMHHLILSDTTMSRYIAILGFCKSRGNRMGAASTLIYILSDLIGSSAVIAQKERKAYADMRPDIEDRVGFTPQAEEVDNIFSDARKYLNKYELLQGTPIYKKLYKFGLYILTIGLLDKVNINFESMRFNKWEAETVRRTHRPGVDMIYCMLDTVTFVCDRGYQYFSTGDPEVFLKTGGSYESWIAKCGELHRHSKLLTNPAPHGIDVFTFTSDVKSCIEKGTHILKYTPRLDKGERMIIQKTLMELQMLESELLNKKNAQEPRKDPFGILVHGSSNICKSQLIQVLFFHYAKVFDLPFKPEFMYTRCPTDEYWSGFNSAQWCIVMDDIGFLKPNGEVDPTLKELLQVKNSVPYTPPQADLADKGRTPIKAELIIGTTNTRHLNLQAYFACPFAIARRLSYIITPHVKPEYLKNGFMADSDKIPVTAEGEYMDIWTFEVSVPRPAQDSEVDAQMTRYEVIERFSNIHEMLRWYIRTAIEHNIAQGKAMRAKNTMRDIAVCTQCYTALKHCVCFDSPNSLHDRPMTPTRPFPQDVVQEPPYSYVRQSGDTADYSPGQSPTSYFTDRGFTAQAADIELEPGEVLLEPPRPTEIDAIVEEPCKYEQELDLYISTLPWWTQLKLSMLNKIFEGQTIQSEYFDPYYTNLFLHYWLRYILCILVIQPWLWIYAPTYLLCIFDWMNFVCIVGVALIYFGASYIFVYAQWFCIWRWGYAWKLRLIRTCVRDGYDCQILLRFASVRIRKSFVQDRRLQLLATFCGGALLLGTLKRLWSTKSMQQQGANSSSFKEGNVPIPMTDEKEVPYYANPYEVEKIQLSKASLCARDITLSDKVRAATARFVFSQNGVFKKSTSALQFYGTKWLFNSHALVECGELSVIMFDVCQNVSGNVSNIRVTPSMFRKIKGTDLAVVDLKSLPPGKNLIPFFPTDVLIPGVYKGTYYLTNRMGLKTKKEVVNVKSGKCNVFGVPGYYGKVDLPTADGDCGSPLLVESTGFQVIFGIHTTGASNGNVFLHHVSQIFLRSCLDTYEPQACSGEHPISTGSKQRALMQVGHRAPIRFLESGSARVLGSFVGYRPKQKSKVAPTYICDYLMQRGYKGGYGPPKTNWEPWHLAIKDLTSPKHRINPDVLDRCTSAYISDISSKLTKEHLSQIEVYSQDVALNGTPGVAYVDRMNVSTSAGNPYKCCKKDFLTIEPDGRISHIDLELQNRVDEIIKVYKSNTMFHPQFCGHLKDDPTPQAKIDSGKTRVFTGSEFAWSIVVRMYTLCFIRVIQNNPFIFESMPGVVAQSTEWQHIYDTIGIHGLRRIICGDYKGFDKKMVAMIVLASFDVLIALARLAGWSEEDITILRCIGYDIAYNCVDMNGDYFMLQGNPSGHPLTVIINCFANCLYIRYAFCLVAKLPVEDFQQYVCLVTYGDDNMMSVSDKCPNFTHTSISVALSTIGVTYTMADKAAESRPYIDISEASFLKRSFKYDADIGSIVAPLELESINKMLTSHVVSNALAPEAHAICQVETALGEYFYHGKELFHERTQFFHTMIKDLKLDHWVQESTFPNYDLLRERFWKRRHYRAISAE